MANRFNYRCPHCGCPDEIEICAFMYVHLTKAGAEISDDVKNIGGESWCSESAADCNACGFQGAVKDFEPQGATVIELFPRQAIRR